MLRGLDLEIRAGEIVGLAGVSGNGQRELAECLAGLRKVSAGSVAMNGEEITNLSLRGRVESGLAYIPEERMRDGAIREFSVPGKCVLARSRFAAIYARHLPGFRAHGCHLRVGWWRSSMSRPPGWIHRSKTFPAATSRS